MNGYDHDENYDTENHTEKSKYTEKSLKPHWTALQKIFTLKCAL